MTRRQKTTLRRRRAAWRPEIHLQRYARWAVAAVMALCAVLLVVNQSVVRPVEARTGSFIMSFAQLDGARAFGSAILFRARGALVGVEITTSCSVALLISPFCLLAGGLIVSDRVSVKRGLATLGVLVVWLFAVNQTRILVIVLSIREWGIDRGYELSHVLLGTVVSTLGVLGGLAIFVLTLAQARRPVELSG